MARDCAEAARAVIEAMHAQVGKLKVDEQGLALRGVRVRHLVMPSLLDDRREKVPDKRFGETLQSNRGMS